MRDFLLMLGVVVFWLIMQAFVLPAFGIGVCLNPERKPMTQEEIYARYGVKPRTPPGAPAVEAASAPAASAAAAAEAGATP